MPTTKSTLLQHHHDNVLLNVPLPAPMMRTPHDLSADEGLFPLDEHVIEGAVTALESGQTHYVDVPGIAPLREQIAADLNATQHSSYQKTNIVVTAGVQESRFLTIQMIGERFERIAIPAVIHPGALKALGVRPMPLDRIPVEAANGYLPTVEAIRATLESGTRFLYLESPSRLTGRAYSADEVRAIAALIVAHDAAVVWDQGLSVWTMGDAYTALSAQPDMAARTAAIGEVVPGMGLASWFISYIAAPEDWITPMQSQKQIMAICTSTASQYAALEAGKLFAQTHPFNAARLKASRMTLIGLAARTNLDVIDGQAVNVLALRLSPDAKARSLATLTDAGYTVADGADFGASDTLRITVTAEATAGHALSRLLV
ncbi:MAG: aminotransferase class I/II-fold pyridoxal phosphate-dependent enzyme [Chloroflexota bacterium]|nr:aminotransferase class I/II-fold pyridoxal phosphate-dependent enzyme [Chloroflexota bacterium]